MPNFLAVKNLKCRRKRKTEGAKELRGGREKKRKSEGRKENRKKGMKE